jgi:hypothetical protein
MTNLRSTHFIVTDTVVSLRARLTTLETNFDVLTEKLRKRDLGDLTAGFNQAHAQVSFECSASLPAAPPCRTLYLVCLELTPVPSAPLAHTPDSSIQSWISHSVSSGAAATSII